MNVSNKNNVTISKNNKEQKKPQPLKAKCFHCRKKFGIKFVSTTSNYGQKNNWDYWTKDKKDKDKKICDPCLLDMYNNHKEEYLSNISDLRKRNLLRNYISDKVIKDKASS